MPGTNPDTKQEYYSGTVDDVKIFCKSLNIDSGRLSTVQPANIEKFQGIVDGAIDGYLSESYFLPIKPYNQVGADGVPVLVFPKRLRLLAQQWTAGMMMMTEFQHQEQNMNEAGVKMVEEAKKEIYQMTLWNHRIPGAKWKSRISKTMPPTFEPAQNLIEQMWQI